MKVLLINPYYPLTEMPSPPLGLAYVAGAFERAGAEVQVLDLVVESYHKRKLERLLATFQPDLVGATCVTMSFDAAMDVLNDVKALRPEVTTLLGGPHISYRAGETLEECPALDVAVLGEGETTVAELMAAFSKNGLDADLSGIAGHAFRLDDEFALPDEISDDLQRFAGGAGNIRLPMICHDGFACLLSQLLHIVDGAGFYFSDFLGELDGMGEFCQSITGVRPVAADSPGQS